MNKLLNIILYIVKYYPYEDVLTKTRLTKLVYLVDWESSLKYRKQMTNISWYFDHFGPYVPDVMDEANNSDELYVVSERSNFGTEKYIIKSKENKALIQIKDLTKEDIEIIDKVINETKSLNWNEFINYVYDTKPIKNSKKYSQLLLNEYI